jgi:carboxyl-terminal processing protease
MEWMKQMKHRSPSRAVSFLIIGVLFLAATSIFAQKLTETRSSGDTTVRLVCEMVQRFHISEKKIDDTVSKKLLDRFIKSRQIDFHIDPFKLYFLQSDINKLRESETKLDDLVKEGNIDFAYETFELCKKLLRKRIEYAHQLIDQEHDFLVDEEMVIDPDMIPWAQSEADIKERWRKRIKYDIVSLKVDDILMPEIRDRLHRRYRGVQRSMEQTEDHDILEAYLSSLTHAFDPHSSYMSPETVEDFEIQMRLRLQGIGAALREKDGYTVVASIVPDGVADKDGRLKKDDKIIGVDKGDGTMIDIIEMKLSKVVRLIRGTKNTEVRLKVKKADETLADGKVKNGETVVYELIRQVIELKQQAVKGEIIQSADRLNGTKSRIGVIHLPSFYRDFEGARLGNDNFRSASRDVKKVLDDFRNQGGVDVVVVDLRWNGGGALTEAIDVSGLFIDEGPVVQVKEQNGDVKPYNDLHAGAAYSGPLVVICNRLSASASEIFAGVIKDYGRGIVIGDQTTHGKGTVQNVMPVRSRQLFRFTNPGSSGMLKLTISQFYRVNGDSTQNRGVRSHIVLPSLLDNMDFGESFLENALKFDHIEPVKFASTEMFTQDMVAQLREASKKRVTQNEKFQETNADIKRYLVRKNKKTVSLVEEKLRKERLEEKELEKQREDAAESKESETSKKEKDENPKDKKIFPDSHYNNEIIYVCLDYLSLLKDMKTAGK